MPMHYKTGEPSLRRISNTKRYGELAPSLSLEGGILSENGFEMGQVVIIYSKRRGQLIIEKYEVKVR